MTAEALPFLLLALLYVALGRLLARRLGAPSRGAEGYAWSAALGTGVASLWLLALSAAGVLSLLPEGLPRMLAVAVPVAALWLAERPRAGRPSPAAPSRSPARIDPWAWPAIAIGALLVLSSLGPEAGEDALAYHLPAAARLASGGAGAFVGLLDAEYRVGFDALWSPGIVLSGSAPSGTAVLHATCSTALAAAVFAEVRRRAGSGAAGIATALLLASSAIADYAILGFVDHAVALYGFLALSAASKALRGEPGPWPALSGALGGFAANAKLSGAAWIAATAVAFLAGLGPRRGARPALVAATAGALVALPLVARSWIVMGNPLFPAFAGSLGSGWADPRAVEHATAVVLGQTGIARGPLLGLEATARAVFDSASGFEAPPWILAFLPAAALSAAWTPSRRGLVAGTLLAWAAWAWFVPVVRFGVGAWAWAAVASASGAARLARGSRPLSLAMLAAALALFAVDARVVWRRSGPRAPA